MDPEAPRFILRDLLVGGIVLGTSAGVVVLLSDLNNPNRVATQGLLGRATSLYNGANTMGNMSKDAVRLLSKINTEKLYAPLKKGGVRVGPVPVDENVIDQED